jgi:hypothetical protein
MMPDEHEPTAQKRCRGYPLAPSAPGDFSVAHGLGRLPVGGKILMTSSGRIWWQTPTLFDATNLYLVASEGGVTRKEWIW